MEIVKYTILTNDLQKFHQFANSSSEAISRFVETSAYSVDEIISCNSGREIQSYK